MKIAYTILIFLLGLGIQSEAEFRIWEDTQGNIWEGEFVTLNAGQVVIRNHADEKNEYDLVMLSASDQSYLEKVLPPKLSIDVSKMTDSTGAGGNSEKVLCQVRIEQMDTRPYKGELTAVLVTMGEDIRTGSTSKVSSSQFSFTLPEKHGTEIEFKGESNTFIRRPNNSGRTYVGYVLVVWDRFGNAVSVKSNRDSFAAKAVVLARPKKR